MTIQNRVHFVIFWKSVSCLVCYFCFELRDSETRFSTSGIFIMQSIWVPSWGKGQICLEVLKFETNYILKDFSPKLSALLRFFGIKQLTGGREISLLSLFYKGHFTQTVEISVYYGTAVRPWIPLNIGLSDLLKNALRSCTVHTGKCNNSSRPPWDSSSRWWWLVNCCWLN